MVIGGEATFHVSNMALVLQVKAAAGFAAVRFWWFRFKPGSCWLDSSGLGSVPGGWQLGSDCLGSKPSCWQLDSGSLIFLVVGSGSLLHSEPGCWQLVKVDICKVTM